MNLIEIAPREDFRLFLRYDNGKSGVINLAALAGQGVFQAWNEPGVFQQVRLAETGHPEWPGGIDLCPDALYLQLTGSQPEELFPSLKQLPAHA